MYNQPTNFPHKLKKPQPRSKVTQSNPHLESAMSGGFTSDILTDANGVVSTSTPKQVPFSPAAARTVEMKSRGNPPETRLTPKPKYKINL